MATVLLHKNSMHPLPASEEYFPSERMLFRAYWMCRPVPVRSIAPVPRIRICRHQLAINFFDAASTMIEMKMRKKYISHICRLKSCGSKGFIQGIGSMAIIMPPEFFILLVAKCQCRSISACHRLLSAGCVSAQLQRLCSSAGLILFQIDFGTTPNMDPPSSLKKPVFNT